MDVSFFRGLNPLNQTLIGTFFAWLITAIGASVVFFTRSINRKFFDALLGFAAGIMLAASFFSLLLPSIIPSFQSDDNPYYWVPTVVGFIVGAMVICIADIIIRQLYRKNQDRNPTSMASTSIDFESKTILVLAITIHNIPEGLAIGVAFGAASIGVMGADLAAAISLTLGIALQNFPEGLAVSMPLRAHGMSKIKSFWYGQLSSTVEPVAGVIGAMFVVLAQPLLPYALSFAAGAMILVVIAKIMPESQKEVNKTLSVFCFIIGFSIMMVLDLALS
ncbi:ZIP family metal transporter [Candidatus Nitrosocosmicus hydrocola]|uniref:ZIP family metal transporter n=1 Tax=Candidatus Nitrosocosmicus hydrocola TaxID=1826872 RepID=UPI000AF14150